MRLYGDLLTTKLKNLSKINKLKAKHELNNIMFRFQLQPDEEINLSPNHQNQNHCASEFTKSPPRTPGTTVETSSPVCNLQHQSAYLILPDISSFRNLQPKSNQQYSYQNSTYLNILSNNASQNSIMNSGLE